VFGDLMEALEDVTLPDAELRTSWLYALTNKINTTPSLYLEAGAIHGCVLCRRIARWSTWRTSAATTRSTRSPAGCSSTACAPTTRSSTPPGRLTSEMVIKTVRMGIPILVSRSGFTAWGVELARKANLTLIGRARGKRFVALAGEDRIVFDQDLAITSRRRAPSTGARRRCMTTEAPTLGLGMLLAGGLARRMGGGDKPLRASAGEPFCARDRAHEPQCARLLLNANGDPARFAIPACRSSRQRAGLRRTARRHPGRPRLGRGQLA
jgi:hypothetical protein